MANGSCNCGAHWKGLSPCHCSSCHVTFSCITAFDGHRKDGKCRTPESLDMHYLPDRFMWAMPLHNRVGWYNSIEE